MWSPEQYARFGDERSRPFHELIARIGAEPTEVRSVVDLGCGPGTLTATLHDRWPSADVLGVDNDEAMLAAAAALAHGPSADGGGSLRFAPGDLRAWSAAGRDRPDVLVSNAALQWDLDHLARLPRLVGCVAPGGWFAFQVPGNLDDAHHQAIRALRSEPRWRSVGTVSSLPERTHVSAEPTDYAEVLAPLARHLDVWTTTYLHILQGADPVLEWVKGTGLRPAPRRFRGRRARADFCAELAPMLRAAYPSKSYGTPFPFRRVFAVAQVA
jgi:trans-aconitate 2-methyltransferase